MVQRRYCFLWEGKTYSLYRYLEPHSDLAILHCQAEWHPKDADQEGSPALTPAAAPPSSSPPRAGGGGLSLEGVVPLAPQAAGDQGAAAAAPEGGGGSMIIPAFLRVVEPLAEDGQYSAYRLSLKPTHPDSPERRPVGAPLGDVPPLGLGPPSSSTGDAMPPRSSSAMF